MTDILDRLREVALALPETTERQTHRRPTFFVADKPFAQFRDASQPDGPAIALATSGEEEQSDLIAASPSVYSLPDDLASDGWVVISLGGDPDWMLVEDRIAQSWELAAPQRLLEAGGR